MILGVRQEPIWQTLPKSHSTGQSTHSLYCMLEQQGGTITGACADCLCLSLSSTDFYEVMDMLDKRLNDKGKNWRHVLKSLKVLDYCLHEGSELVVTWARKNIYIIKTLREFIYLDDDGRDVGASSKAILQPGLHVCVLTFG